MDSLEFEAQCPGEDAHWFETMPDSDEELTDIVVIQPEFASIYKTMDPLNIEDSSDDYVPDTDSDTEDNDNSTPTRKRKVIFY